MDDRIIDLGEYIRKRGRGMASQRITSTYGTDRARTRYGLSLWRCAYLLKGSRAGIVWEEVDAGDPRLHPLFVLDLAEDPARTTFEREIVGPLVEAADPPAVHHREGQDLTIFLGEQYQRRWYMVVADMAADTPPPQNRVRNDIFFLAGELAALVLSNDRGPDPQG